jgi:serine/threonine protein kinase
MALFIRSFLSFSAYIFFFDVLLENRDMMPVQVHNLLFSLFGQIFFIFFPVQGTFPDGRMVAVKQLSATSHQGKRQFVTEISTISAVQHKNLVKLYGCCIEGSKPLLVYEYLENRSLDQALFGNVLSKDVNLQSLNKYTQKKIKIEKVYRYVL